MGSQYDAITAEQAELIRNAPLFFVATADPTGTAGPHGIGPVNVSPRGGVPLHIVSPTRVAFLDHPGSGNETARHVLAGSPMTLMVCSFDADAAIVRLYGKARVCPVAESPHAETLLQHAAAALKQPRQVFELDVERTSTSCGYGVPMMTFVRERRMDDRGRRYKA
jgi:hypothetical protein